MIENKIEQIKVVIVGVNFQKDLQFEYYMQELENLAIACEFVVVGKITQKLERIDSKHYLKTGKIIELKDLVNDVEADLIILNNEVSGMQNKNIEKICEVKVMDRTQLILEIFSKRAKTKEAKMQVAIAKLKYQKPRMIGSYENLDRQGSGVLARGKGETKLETDRRKIDSKIAKYENELEKFVASRKIQRNNRNENEIPIVAIVGYTNAGKSTLMNVLVNQEKQVFEKDMLFATLDTSVRKIKLENKQQFLLVDTVGFVSNLPHDLVKAFRSTLEEIKTADLIIHLSDLSSVDVQIHKDVVRKTLKIIDANNINLIEVNNKVDLVESVNISELNISAKNNYNIDILLDCISKEIFKLYKVVKLAISYQEISLLDQIRNNTNVFDIQYLEDMVTFMANLSLYDQEKLNSYIIQDNETKKGEQ